jgi:hypothetical protein
VNTTSGRLRIANAGRATTGMKAPWNRSPVSGRVALTRGRSRVTTSPAWSASSRQGLRDHRPHGLAQGGDLAVENNRMAFSHEALTKMKGSKAAVVVIGP